MCFVFCNPVLSVKCMRLSRYISMQEDWDSPEFSLGCHVLLDIVRLVW